MAPLRGLLALLALLPLAAPQCTLEHAKNYYRRAVYEFSADLLQRIAEDTEGHFVASTLSPYTLLTAISIGAADDTLVELQRVLRHQRHQCFFPKYLKLSQLALSSDESAVLERSGALFVDDTVGLKRNFKKTLTDTGVCEISPLSFGDFSAAAVHINDYVRSTTHGIIDEIVNAADLEGVYIMLIDAMYFKGKWRTAFSVENTQTAPFFDSLGNELGQVNLMYLNNHFNSTYLEPIRASVLELPYGSTNRFSMLIFLPDDRVLLTTVIDNLKKISLGSVFGLFRRQGPHEVSVQLPRFKITSDLGNMKELLIDMGLKKMFDSNIASFPELSDYQLYVSSFIQKADIEVTEEGTVAAAATEVGFSFRSSVLDSEFIANKPFLFMVVDRELEVMVFSGAYSRPTLY